MSEEDNKLNKENNTTEITSDNTSTDSTSVDDNTAKTVEAEVKREMLYPLLNELEGLKVVGFGIVIFSLLLFFIFTSFGGLISFNENRAGNALKSDVMLPKSTARLEKIDSLIAGCQKWDRNPTLGDKRRLRMLFTDVRNEKGEYYGFDGIDISQSATCLNGSVSIIPTFDKDKVLDGFVVAEYTTDGWAVLLNYLPYQPYTLVYAVYGKTPTLLYRTMFGIDEKNDWYHKFKTGDKGDYIQIDLKGK